MNFDTDLGYYYCGYRDGLVEIVLALMLGVIFLFFLFLLCNVGQIIRWVSFCASLHVIATYGCLIGRKKNG